MATNPSAFTGTVSPTFTGVSTFNGNAVLNAGAGVFSQPIVFHSGGGGTNTNSEAAVAILTPAFANGTAAQLTDTAKDYMVYLTCTTSGTAFSLAIGPTSTPANSLASAVAVSAGEMFAVRLPATWFLQWAATTAAFAEQIAIGC